MMSISRQTDGFSDNVFPSEMQTICSLIARAGGSEEQQVQIMADRMVDYARSCMKNKTKVSPFERKSLSSLSLRLHLFCLLRNFALLILTNHFIR
jgi:hypothetical protein